MKDGEFNLVTVSLPPGLNAWLLKHAGWDGRSLESQIVFMLATERARYEAQTREREAGLLEHWMRRNGRHR